MSFLESMKDPKGALYKDSNFQRYWSIWKANEESFAFVPLADLIRRQGFLAESLDICEKGLTHHPESVSGHLLLAKLERDMGDLVRLREIIAKLNQMAPQNEEVRALVKEFQVEWPKTEETAASQTKTQDKPWDTVTMAEVYAQQGEIQKGIKTLNKILKTDPDNEKAKILLEKLKKESEKKP